MGSRKLPFSRELYIEKDDFLEDPPKKYFRLRPEGEVRLRYAYVIKCNKVIKDEKTGEVVELHCSLDPDTLGKKPEGRKVKGIIHWVSAKNCKTAEVRLYDRLFNVANPAGSDGDFIKDLNPDSLVTINDARIEPSLTNAKPNARFQFERLGYFSIDSKDSAKDKLVFNRTVTLKDSWAKITKEKS